MGKCRLAARPMLTSPTCLSLEFDQAGLKFNGRYHDTEGYSIEARKLMEKFSLETPNEILPYLKKHYNTLDCFYRIKKDLDA